MLLKKLLLSLLCLLPMQGISADQPWDFTCVIRTTYQSMQNYQGGVFQDLSAPGYINRFHWIISGQTPLPAVNQQPYFVTVSSTQAGTMTISISDFADFEFYPADIAVADFFRANAGKSETRLQYVAVRSGGWTEVLIEAPVG